MGVEGPFPNGELVEGEPPNLADLVALAVHVSLDVGEGGRVDADYEVGVLVHAEVGPEEDLFADGRRRRAGRQQEAPDGQTEFFVEFAQRASQRRLGGAVLAALGKSPLGLVEGGVGLQRLEHDGLKVGGGGVVAVARDAQFLADGHVRHEVAQSGEGEGLVEEHVSVHGVPVGDDAAHGEDAREVGVHGHDAVGRNGRALHGVFLSTHR